VSDKFQHILDNMPEKPPRSRLEPYGELIMELRRRKRTYREILDVLAEKCDLPISISTLHDFVRMKAKEARKAAKVLRTTAQGARAEDRGSAPPRAAAPKMAEDRPSDEEVRRRIAALKARPKSAPAEPSKQFEYNPDEPLRLLRPGKQD
jgi:IS30 family transposase